MVSHCHLWVYVFLGSIRFSVLPSPNLNVDGGCRSQLCQGMKITNGLVATCMCCVYPDPTMVRNSSGRMFVPCNTDLFGSSVLFLSSGKAIMNTHILMAHCSQSSLPFFSVAVAVMRHFCLIQVFER